MLTYASAPGETYPNKPVRLVVPYAPGAPVGAGEFGQDLVSLAKGRPGTINFASAGSGSTAHLSSELFKSMTGIDIVHIPHKGAGPALTDLVGGQIQIMFTGVSATLPHVKSGKLKALAVSSEKRMRILPDVPTVSEDVPRAP